MTANNVDPAVARARARLSSHSYWHPEDVEGIAEMKAELERAMLRHTLKRFTLPREEMAEIVLEGASE